MKSLNYIESMHEIKEKWAVSYIPWKFTAGIYTTSRAESINALIKRYVNSKCEITDMIKFLIDFEKKCAFQEFKSEKMIEEQYNQHPIVTELRNNIFGVVFEKYFEEFCSAHYYSVKFINADGVRNILNYEAASINNPNKLRKLHVVENKYVCVKVILDMD